MLQFDENGRFRILVIADIQDFQPLNAEKQKHIESLILRCDPHLVVLLGDMLFGPAVLTKKRAEQIIDSITEPLDKNRTHFVFVTGNHDKDARVSVGDQVDMYAKSPWCLTPAISDRACADAYCLDIRDDGDRPAAGLLFLDSGATRLMFSGIDYDPASASQMKFTRSLLSGGMCPPVFVFQHIPVPEIYRLVKTVPSKVPGSVKGRGPYRGKQLILKDQLSGSMNESPCPPWENAGQFDMWAESGKVRAAVFGHDHKNSFEGAVDGISLIQTSCAGLSCYGLDELRGGRLLTVFRDGHFLTKPLYYRDSE